MVGVCEVQWMKPCYTKQESLLDEDDNGAHRQTGWPTLHAVLLTALAGGHGLVGRRSTGLGAKWILGEFLITETKTHDTVISSLHIMYRVTTYWLYDMCRKIQLLTHAYKSQISAELDKWRAKWRHSSVTIGEKWHRKSCVLLYISLHHLLLHLNVHFTRSFIWSEMFHWMLCSVFKLFVFTIQLKDWSLFN